MSEHSPGPWRFEDGWVICADGNILHLHKPENGVLVAAAPDMLELLREIGQWYCGEMADGTDRRVAIAALIARIGD